MIYVSLVPAVDIYSNDKLVIEIPLMANDGTAYFANDNGVLNLAYDSQIIIVEALYGANAALVATSLSLICRGYNGSAINKFNAKIVCSDFNVNYLANYSMKIAFKITNPTVTTPIMIPLIIYSESLSTRRKTNYNYIENGIYVKILSGNSFTNA